MTSLWPLHQVDDGVALSTRIGRQQIVDTTGRQVASELLFRGRDAETSGLVSAWDAVRDEAMTAELRRAAADQATSHVIVSTFGDFGLDRLSAGLPLFLNVTRSFLDGTYPLPFDAQHIVLEVLEDVDVDDAVVEGVARLREQGFAIALDDYQDKPGRERLLPYVDIVKIDVLDPRTDVEAVAVAVREAAPHVQLLAERVETEQQHRRCLDAGFELFQGYLFAHPQVLESTQLSPNQVSCVRLLQLLSDPETGADELERVVASDPGMAVRVLRTANSAATGSRRAISSLKQALVLLGPRTLQSWVVLAVLGGGTATEPAERLATVLTRAEACQAVAGRTGRDAAAAYTLGLISGVAEVLRVPAGQMAEDAGLPDEVVDALVEGAGDLGPVLRTVRGHELDLPDAAEGSGLDPLTLSNLYLGAWTRAREVVGSLLGTA